MQAVLDLAVERVHRRPVEADRADPVLDLEADEVGHDDAPVGLAGGGVDAHDPLVPDVHAREDHLDRDLDEVREVGARGDDVLAGDDEGRAGDPALDAVEVEVELVAGVEELDPVGLEVLPRFDGHSIDVAHELADVLTLSREAAARRDAFREHNGVEKLFRKAERRQLGFLELDELGAQVLRRRSLALARALARTIAEFLRFLVFLHRTILPCKPLSNRRWLSLARKSMGPGFPS